MTYKRNLRKDDKSSAEYSRRSRFTQFQNRWYFVTREQEMRGPYTSARIAKIAAKIFVRSITLQQRYSAKICYFTDYQKAPIKQKELSSPSLNNASSCKVIPFKALKR